MKVLSITLSLAVLLALAPAAMAVDVWALPMDDFKVQFTFGPPTQFLSHTDVGGVTRAGMFMHNLVGGAPEHNSDANLNPMGMLHGVKLSDIAQINIGYLDVDDNNEFGVSAPHHRSGSMHLCVDWDGDMDPLTQPADSMGNVGFRIYMDILYTAMMSTAGTGLAEFTTLPLDTWVDMKLTPQLQCLEVGNHSHTNWITAVGQCLWDPNGNPGPGGTGMDGTHNFMSLNQMTAKFPNARFSGLCGWAWPTPETNEICVDAGGFPQTTGIYYDYLDIYQGQRLQGDANGDMLVDVADLGILSAGWGTFADTTLASNLRYAADFNGDLIVDVGDLGMLSGGWGSTIAQTWTSDLNNFTDVPGGLGAGVIPLPSAFGAGLALMGLAMRRRR